MALLGTGGANRTWILKIVADIEDAKRGIQNVEKTTQGFATTAKSIGRGVATALGSAAVIQFGKSIVNAASDTEQSLGAARAVFGEFSGEIESFGKTAAKNLGISNQEFLQMSSLMGSLISNAGVPLQETTKFTKELTTAAADLSAMYGGTAADAMAAMSSALKGEFDPLQNFGITLKASTIEAKALAMGYVDAAGKVTEAGKVMATQALIMEQGALAAGANAREANTLAGQTQRMQAQFKDLQAVLGKALLPILVQLMQVLRPIIEFIAANADWLVPLAGAIMGVVLAVKAWTTAQLILNSALFASPIGLIVLAIGAVVAAIVLLVKNWDDVKKVVDVVVNAIVDAWNWFVDFITGLAKTIFDIYTWPYRQLWEAAQWIFKQLLAAWDWVVRSIGNLMSGLGNTLIYPFQRAWDGIRYIGEQVKGIWSNFLGHLRWIFGQVYDVITWPFRRAMDGIKWLWNSTIGGFGFTIPSWIPLVGGKDFRIPKMASGGIVTRPTIAMIGEAGPEAVIPLSQFSRETPTVTYNVNVYALNATSETGRLVAESLREYNRTAGAIG